MSKSARRLGRGLDSLVSNLRPELQTMTAPKGEGPEGTAGASVPSDEQGPRAMMVAVDALSPNPLQPRDNIDTESIISLAQSIQENGILQPLSARHRAGRYEIILGERRWRAARSLGISHVPVIIRDASDEQMLEFALIENIQREDLNAIDRARAYREFCTRFEAKPEELAARVGEDRTTVVNYLRLLDLPDSIQALVAGRKLSMGHARCLLGVTDGARRLRLAESVVENELSVRALEEIVRREKTRQTDALPIDTRKERTRPAHLQDLQQRFEEVVKTKVTIHEGKRKGTGRIVIEYYSLDDFDRVAALLNVRLE